MTRGKTAPTKPISVQLYSLREETARDLQGTLERLAAIGYRGVEPFTLHGKPAPAFKAQVEALGLEVSSSHYPWANRAAASEVVDTMAGLGLRRAAAGFGADDFKDLDAVKRTADTINGLTDALAPHGIDLFLHNHWWEFQVIDGKLGFQHIAERCPDVQFEVDTYWAANFGAVDVAAEVARLKHRVPLLHIKDGPLIKGEAHVAVGDGRMDIPAIIRAADPNTLEWVIVELDACETDMMTAIERSHRYLTENRLAVGSA